MQHEMLPVSVDASQARAADILRVLPPARRHLDRIHALAHQFSQRVTPARNRMTFRHNTTMKREECRQLGDILSSDSFAGHLTFAGEAGSC